MTRLEHRITTVKAEEAYDAFMQNWTQRPVPYEAFKAGFDAGYEAAMEKAILDDAMRVRDGK